MRDFNPNILSTSTLSGNTVVNAKGEDLGEIKDFMLDLDEGRIAYAVLSFGGVFGFGDKLFALPWDALEVNTTRECFVLNVSKDKLKDAPGFDKNDWPSKPNRDFLERIHTHWGVQPYWQRQTSTTETLSRN